MNATTFGIGCITLLALTATASAEPMPSSLTRKSDFDSGCALSGTTLDLAEIGVRTATLAPGESETDRLDADLYEELLIVRNGELSIRGDGDAIPVGPGSVAVTYPDDERVLANAGHEPATFYRFTYRTHEHRDRSRASDGGGSFVVDWEDVEYVPSDIGGRRQMFDRSTAMFDRFEMHVSTLNGGLTNHPAHTHRAEEFVLVVEGTVAMLIGDRVVEAGPGDLIFIESMIPHSLDNTGETPATYFAFQYQP